MTKNVFLPVFGVAIIYDHLLQYNYIKWSLGGLKFMKSKQENLNTCTRSFFNKRLLRTVVDSQIAGCWDVNTWKLCVLV